MVMFLFPLILCACAWTGPGPDFPSLYGPSNPTGSTPQPGGNPGPSQKPVPTALDAEEQAFLAQINQYRASVGAPPLLASIALTTSSKWLSQDMAAKNYLSHTDSQGRDPFTRMDAFGYTDATSRGENIAAGNGTAADTFT